MDYILPTSKVPAKKWVGPSALNLMEQLFAAAGGQGAQLGLGIKLGLGLGIKLGSGLEIKLGLGFGIKLGLGFGDFFNSRGA